MISVEEHEDIDGETNIADIPIYDFTDLLHLFIFWMKNFSKLILEYFHGFLSICQGISMKTPENDIDLCFVLLQKNKKGAEMLKF